MERVKPMLLILPIVVCLVFITMVVHEFVHLITAFAMRIPLVNFTWFDPRTISPAITFGFTNNELGMAIVHYAGGLVTGALWLTVCFIFFVSKKYAERSLALWSLGLFIAILAFWQIGQGVLEGCLHEAYLLGAGKVGSASFIVQSLFIFLGFLAYFWRTHLWREFVRKKPKIDS